MSYYDPSSFFKIVGTETLVQFKHQNIIFEHVSRFGTLQHLPHAPKSTTTQDKVGSMYQFCWFQITVGFLHQLKSLNQYYKLTFFR